ncbi:9952_t:CDS:10 [Entrophospora sp. SA101]|nr:9952_t:CDS:10 [Entrophospora sp. SA101]
MKPTELELTPSSPTPLSTPTSLSSQITDGEPNRKKKIHENKDSIFSVFLGQVPRSNSLNNDSTMYSTNHLTPISSSNRRGGSHIRKLSTENLKSTLLLPENNDGFRRKSFDSDRSSRHDFCPPPEIAPFAYQYSPSDSRKGSTSTISSITDSHYFKIGHRRTKSSESESGIESSNIVKEKKTKFKWFKKPKDKEPKDKDITPEAELDWVKVSVKKDKLGKKKDHDSIGINLDTNFDNMEGIIRQSRISGARLYDNEFLHKNTIHDLPQLTSTTGSEAWLAPESWAVIKELPNESPNGFLKDEFHGSTDYSQGSEERKKLFCIRIFRPDSTFGTVSYPISITAAELCHQEKPLLLQKKWLERAGYTDQDNLEDLGREDNSYLVRFTFRETTVPSFEEDASLLNFQHVDLRARNLQTIPIFLHKYAYYIQVLDVSQNLMLDLPTDFIQSCTQLRELRLFGNELDRVPQSVKQSFMLSNLNLSSNNLCDIDHIQLSAIGGLTILKVENNKLQHLPDYFTKFNSLSVLNIANNSFVEFPVIICKIFTLSELDLSFNKIVTIPEDIGKLSNLKRLFLIGNQLSGPLPENFMFLVSLKELDVRNNQLHNIDILSSVPNLECLLAESNKVSTINSSSNSLKRLMLSKNRLTQFWLTSAGTCLTELLLSRSKLTTLHDEIFESLPLIEKLDISNNQFVTLPKKICLLTKLTHLLCAYNILSELPSDISSMKALQVLDVHYNNLNSLPKEIWLCLNLRTLNAKLRVLNLSFNSLDEIPNGGITNPHLTELYLSGNQLSSLPDEIERLSGLMVLHLNGNKLQTLPAELSKIRKLILLDVGNNSLKYNIANWQYDWNWNWNFDLKYLNLSGNKRFEIKQVHLSEINPIKERNLADFNALTRLQVLGLMDVTLLNLMVPDESDDRRVRTSSSEVNSMSYGMADRLGPHDHHLSIWETVIPKFRGRDDECLFGIFDGRYGTDRSDPVTKYLHDWLPYHFKAELEKLKDNETVESAIRRTFLSLNKELGSKVFNSSMEAEYTMEKENNRTSSLQIDDNKSGASGLIAYISGTKLYVASAGDTTAVISRNDGNAHAIACCENPNSPNEFQRIRDAGGFLSHDFLVNGEIEVSRSFGHFHLMPIINSDPVIELVELSEQDEFVILATKGLWDHMSYQTAVDIARTEKEDLMLAAQKLRDFAITYGSEKKLMVMIIGVGDMFDQRLKRYTMAGDLNTKRGILQIAEEVGTTFFFGTSKKRIRKEEIPSDSMMARLQKEITPPTGQVALVFTDIKNSTFLWETVPVAMRHAIKQHNTIMRRLLRNIGGYEVKTEGDAFMVSFPTVTSALLWCLTVQVQLLEVDWPQEIIDLDDGKEIYGGRDNDMIYRGLSVRMGIHWGTPLCEIDVVTKRMDYYGPMVNRAARICNAADGGQICVSSDIVSEIRLLGGLINKHDPNNEGNGEMIPGNVIKVADTTVIVDKNLIALRKMGFVVQQIGEIKLKGLENPEQLSLVYPDALKGRMEEDKSKDRHSIKIIDPTAQILDPTLVRSLGYLCLRLERVSSGTMNQRSSRNSRTDYLTGLLTFHVKDIADDEELLRIVESLITRIENSISTLYLKKVQGYAKIIEELYKQIMDASSNME